jgi:hypothetical protein
MLLRDESNPTQKKSRLLEYKKITDNEDQTDQIKKIIIVKSISMSKAS